MSNPAGTFELLAGELARVFEPLAQRREAGLDGSLLEWLGLRLPGGVADSAGLTGALATSGTAAAELADAIRDFAGAIAREDARAAVAASARLVELIAKIVNAATGAADALQTLSTVAPGLSPQQRAQLADFAGEFVGRLLNRLLVEYVEARFPQLAAVLIAASAIEVVEESGGPAGSLNGAYTRKTFRFDRMAKLFSDPAGLLSEVYRWGEPDFDGLALFRVLQTLLERQRDIPAQILQPAGLPAILEAFGFNAEVSTPSPGLPPGLDLTFRSPGAVSISESIQESDWEVTFASEASFPADLLVTLRPLLDVAVELTTGNADFRLAVDVSRASTAAPFLLLGTADGTRLEVRSPGLGAELDVHFEPSTGRVVLDPEIRGSLRGGRLVISGAGGDSFISTLLAGINIESSFDVGLTWSPSQGVRFTGSAALEIAIPSHVTLGPLEILSLYLRAELTAGGAIPVEMSGGFAATLGPLKASVDRLGLTARFTFPEGGGNLGPADVQFAFKPPNGVGLVVDAGVVKGGGYLYLDFEKGEYAGVLELTIAGFIAVKAIALINTRLPGGQPGFSLLVIITAEFTPGFQLGFGFTLLGVGGLLGLNRSVLLDPLAQGVRTGAVNSILFPTNVIANAPRILSDLRAIFPPHEGTFLIGPMAKIGWGTPTLISVSLGVILEIPGNVVILGRLRVALPTDEAAVLVLQVSFIGAIEFDKRRIWFFASMFESRVLFITLEGEMGLLMDFSDNPNFVLSVGGFHPRFTAPALPFPSPARIALVLINESWARVRAEGYFAVTSNSVQMGCRLEAFFGFDAFSVSGHFGFDALIRFSPFYFIVEISVGFSVKIFGVGVWGVHLRASLEGTTPWRIRGSAEISFLFFSFDVDVDVTFGERRTDTLPPIEVLPKMRLELEKPESWRATLPPSGQHFVSLREIGSADALVLHPVGTLQISQRFAPLNFPLDKVGSQKPSDVNRLGIVVAAGPLAVKGATREKFATGQYRDLDDAAKLSAPAFEPLDSGVELGAAGQPWATGPLAQRNVRYETIILDTALEPLRIFFFRFWDGLFAHFRGGASVARANTSLANERRLQPFADRVEIAEDQFTVASQADGKAYTPTATFGSYAEAQAHLETAMRLDPSLSDTLHVIPSAEVNRAA